MAFQSLFLVGFSILLAIGSAQALNPAGTLNPPAPKAISDLKDAVVKVLGFQSEDLKISGFDIRDALVGQSVAYEFDLEIGNKKYPFKLVEDVNRWEYVDLPIFRVEESASAGENGLAKSGESDGKILPVLSPFQLAGPMELWIQDGDDMRVSLPHDVDAGIVKKVMLAEGTVVTVKGARSVSLRHSLDLPLPLNRSGNNLASGLLTLADHLRLTSLTQQKPLLSLRIVGPTSLASPASSSPSRLKLKRLAPGLVELSKSTPSAPIVPIREDEQTILSPDRFTTLWPLTSINGSNMNLQGFEKLLHSVLGDKASKAGSFRLVKAEVSAQTSVKMGFRVERRIKDAEMERSKFPEWRTKPETVRMYFEVLGKVEGEKVVPERVVEVEDPAMAEDTVAPNILTGNMTMSTMPILHPPPNYFTL